MRPKKIQIACDGGAATGKSTGAKLIYFTDMRAIL